MSKISEEVDNKIKDMSFEDFSKKQSNFKQQKESLGKTLLLWPFRLIKAILGIDIRSRGGYATPSNNDVPSPVSPHEKFVQGYTFNPEAEYIKRMQADAYTRLVDGRGDPTPPPPCNHDHDEK